MGVGKSGHIAQKISATLSSTGTPSIFVHPTEAAHGDMGLINKNNAQYYLGPDGVWNSFDENHGDYQFISIKDIVKYKGILQNIQKYFKIF